MEDLAEVLEECKVYVDGYQKTGFASKLIGVFLSRDKKKLEDLNGKIDRLIHHFGFVNAADNISRAAAGGGKVGDGLARALWRDIQKSSKILGQGATATVYKGTWMKADVAIKTMHTGANMADIKKELAVIHSLGFHKNIISLMAICDDLPRADGQFAIVMELAGRGDLQTYLERATSQIPMSLLLRIAFDIADGMRYCASRGLIHRDLKTKNVCIDENDRAKICDFGLSRFLDTERTAMTAANLGTQQYSAPEVLDPPLNAVVHPSCDVYSFGVIFWEMVTGKRPWEGKTLAQICLAFMRGEMLPIDRSWDVAIQKLIFDCLQKDPRNRPGFETIHAALYAMCVAEDASGKSDNRASGSSSASFSSSHSPPQQQQLEKKPWFFHDGEKMSPVMTKGELIEAFIQREIQCDRGLD